MEQKTVAAHAPYSFDVEQQGDKYVFTYKRSKYGFPVLLGLCFIVGLPLWLIFYLLLKSLGGTDIGLMPLYWGLFCTVCIYLLMNRRRRGRFEISKTAFHVNGRSYDRSHILRVFVKDPENKYQPSHLVADLISSVIDTMLTSNYSICFAYGESRVKLAGGLSEVAAKTMLNKINQVLKSV